MRNAAMRENNASKGGRVKRNLGERKLGNRLKGERVKEKRLRDGRNDRTIMAAKPN
jgi:hypothetical protein